MKKILAILIAMSLILGCMAGALAEGTVKYTETEMTKDNWIKVEQEGGPTLGYSPDSGVKLLTVDGYAFKDMNRNGELDDYEDWRLDANTRAGNLASQLDADTILPLMFHHTLQQFGTEIGEKDYELFDAGLRNAISRSSAYADKAETAAVWTNKIEAYVEGKDYAIPFMISTDPTYMMNSPTNMALASTFDPEYLNKFAQAVSKQFRAVGVAMYLGPQVDVSSEPRWGRFVGSLSEDPALARDLVKALDDGFQSTYDEEGNDLGWGKDSIVTVTKHYPGTGSGEYGGDAHQASGKYNVYPGDNFAAHLIPFFDGALKLEGKTGETGAIMPGYPVSYSEDEKYGELVGSAMSEFKIGLLRNNGYDGLILTDWAATTFNRYGYEDKEPADAMYAALEAGDDQLGGIFEVDALKQAYAMMIEEYGEEEALAKIRNSARRILVTMINAGLFENPYLDTEACAAVVNDEAALALGYEAQEKAIIMLKNKDNTIHAREEGEKQTAYIPYIFRSSDNTWSCPVDLELAGEYYNIVTDTIGEPTGAADANGNATYTVNDIIRATPEELTKCDLAIALINSPTSPYSYYNPDPDTSSRPRSLQLGEYVADSDSVRKESIIKEKVVTVVENPYGTTEEITYNDLSYFGKGAKAISNASDLDTIKYAAENIPENAKLIVSVTAMTPMVVGEFEPYADALLYNFGLSDRLEETVSDRSVLEVIIGNAEPSALLPAQIPADMPAVEAQLEDVPRDMQCYVDTAGNTYDFGFGLNWSGVIQDERTAKYCVPALTVPENNPLD